MPRTKNSRTDRKNTVVIRHHHHKPYRKRHYGLLILACAIALGTGLYSWHYHDNLNRGVTSAKNFISDLFSGDIHNVSLESAYGFSIAYDQNQLNASAIDGNTGNLYLGNELQTKRPYTLVRLSSGSITGDGNNFQSLSIRYYPSEASGALDSLESKLAQPDLTSGTSQVGKVSSESVSLGGQKFLKTTWKSSPAKLSASLAVHFTTYTGVVNGKPLIIAIHSGFSTDDSWASTIVNSISFKASSVQASIPSLFAVQKAQTNLSLLDRLVGAGIANAAAPTATPAEKSSALYSPAVVKIYNVYCMDISIDGQPYIKDACAGWTGSGFFVGSDGYIATNGHVATSTPRDIVFTDAIIQAENGDAKLFDALTQMAGVTQSDIAGSQSDAQTAAIIINKWYDKLADSHFTPSNNVTNLLVDLNEKEPKADELITLTKARQSYTEQDSIKHATLKAYNYRALDGINGFKASDVALIKIKGSNYPVMTLGTIENLSQGANLSILGFPGNASDNGIVAADQSKVTLTTGKVSSIKNASGSSNKLIETDTTIGHGNSGGPVMDDNGNVVGIATYTADGSGQGNGVFNYIRDIKDLKDLASKSGVSFNLQSTSQAEWAKAISLFYSGHYSKSLKVFAAAKADYPQNSRVAEFVTEAQQRIKNGEDVKDFPTLIVGIGALLAVGGAAAAIYFIRSHKRTHEVYKHQVATGQMQPIPQGAPAQTVSYNPAAVPTAKTVFGPPQAPPPPSSQISPTPQTPQAPLVGPR